MCVHTYITIGYICTILTINTVINIIIIANTLPPMSPPASAESALLPLPSLPAYVCSKTILNSSVIGDCESHTYVLYN